MKLSSLSLSLLFVIVLLSTPAAAQPYAYVTNVNASDGSITVIDTATLSVVSTVRFNNTPSTPNFVAITPDGAHAYITNSYHNNVLVVDTSLALTDPGNALVAIIPVGTFPRGIAITPDGADVYVINEFSSNVSIIDTAQALTNPGQAVVAKVPTPTGYPFAVAFTPDGTQAYVTDPPLNRIYAIDTALALTNPLKAVIPTGTVDFPFSWSPTMIAIPPNSMFGLVTLSGIAGLGFFPLPPVCESCHVGAAALGNCFQPDGALIGYSFGIAISPVYSSAYVTYSNTTNTCCASEGSPRWVSA